MRAVSFICGIAAFLFLCPFAEAASASERLIYPENLSQRSRASLERYALEKLDMDAATLRIAAADLNRDGLSEYILHRKTCDGRKADCLYSILADTPDGIIPLGTITGKALLLGDGFSHGVRDILALENELNDYEYTPYVWTPEKASYGKKDE